MARPSRLALACSTAAAGLALVLLVTACGRSASGPSSYQQDVMQSRVQRDMEMREAKTTVIPPSRLSAFRGLNYYDVDTTYRFVVPLQRRAQPDTVRMPESTGTVSEQVVVGSVAVPFPQGTAQLNVLRVRSGPDRGQLWIPFADATNGEATYRAGRYVDLRPAPGDSVVVDFNRAYNPTCTYNPSYACPLPPPENRVSFPIPAGEKTPSFSS
jgi:hypothetical protein